MKNRKINIYWFRRDLRLNDNHALFEALSAGLPVLPIFIFDENILASLPENDHRVTFIYDCLSEMQGELENLNSSLLIKKGDPLTVWNYLTGHYQIDSVFFNHDYEPYAVQRDQEVSAMLKEKSVKVFHFKDQVIFEKEEVLKNDGTPYTVYTPYKNKWLATYGSLEEPQQLYPSEKLLKNMIAEKHEFPELESLGFQRSSIKPLSKNPGAISEYDRFRNFPAIEGTSRVSTSLRFGTISIREIVLKAMKENELYLSELIWREFFMQVLYHFPRVEHANFKPQYDGVEWEDNENWFEAWKQGKTGYALVDAGMRELNKTGYMHNRVRMICASFLCKHLLIDWRWGEAYFAEKLFDYELASNNGNWQWAAGTGCDAAPYFRVFNPETQLKKFDPDMEYVKKWIPEFGTDNYPDKIVDHKKAREKALKVYKKALTF